MTQVGQVSVGLGLDDAKFKQDLNKAQKTTNTFAKNMRTALAGIAAGFTLGAVINEMKQWYAAAEEAIRVERRLESVLRATGYTAGMTSDELINLASEIQSLTGVSDELIKETQTVLLTFRNLSRDVFPETLKLTQDMATVMGTDMKSAALQVGKALNDPIQGLTALRRVGVAFTEQQKEQIKTLVESGKRTEAQKIILAELRQEFGGAAEASKTYTMQITTDLDDLREELGRLIGLDNSITKFIAGLVSGLKDWAYNLRIVNAEITSLRTTELSDRLAKVQKQISAYNEALNKTKSLNMKQYTEGLISSLRKEEQAILNQIDILNKKDEVKVKQGQELAKQQQAEEQRAIAKEKAAEKAKEMEKIYKQTLEDTTKEYIKQQRELQIAQQSQEELGGFAGSFGTGYSERLELLKWYYTEYDKISTSAFANKQQQQEAFNQLELLNAQKTADLEKQIWQQRGHDIYSIFENTFSQMLTNYGDFGDNMKQLALNLIQYLLKEELSYAMQSIAVEQMRAKAIQAIRAAIGFIGSFFGGGGMAMAGAVAHSGHTFLPTSKHHYGGTIPQADQTEHFALLKNNERVLSPAETASYNNNQGQQGGYIVYAPQVRAMDSRDVAQWFNDNKNQIISIVSEGINRNQQGLRTQIQGV